MLDGKLAFQKALGVKEQGKTDPLTNDGKLDLAAPVTTYIPAWKLLAGSDPAKAPLDPLLSPVATPWFVTRGGVGARQD